MEIKKIDGTILYTCDCEAIADALSAAVKSGANLSGANLSGADLSGANIRCANLSCANLSGAILGGADISGADLSGANIRCANLLCANLGWVNLSGADLSWVNLSGADLSCANLSLADLRWADLSCANLSGADLSGANIRCANLDWANIRDTENIPYIPLSCPSDGEFTAWKKVNGRLVKLLIPKDARRSSATTDKCRCDKAMVVAITSIDEKEEYREATSNKYTKMTYKVGEMAYSDSFDENRWNECSNGIHFFINKQDAINY